MGACSLDGSVSATGDLSRKLYGGQYVREIEASGMMFEGNFLAGAGNEGANQAGYGKFATRQDAMTNAFHYARAAAEAGVVPAAVLNSEARSATEPTAERSHDTRIRRMDYANANSMLLIQFGADSDGLVKGADGAMSFVGFEVTHATYGRMLAIDAKGGLTFYDQSGRAYGADEYDQAAPDGVIAELWNMVNGKTPRFDLRG